MSRAVLPAHGKDAHRCNGPDPIPVLVHLKVFADGAPALAGDDAKRFTVTDDLGGTFVRSVHATVTEAGTGDTEIQVHNITTGNDILDSTTIIEGFSTNSYDAFNQHFIDPTDPPVNYVSRGDVLRVDIDTGSDATGLEVLLEFGPNKIIATSF